jgi:hypothetical protein
MEAVGVAPAKKKIKSPSKSSSLAEGLHKKLKTPLRGFLMA